LKPDFAPFGMMVVTLAVADQRRTR